MRHGKRPRDEEDSLGDADPELEATSASGAAAEANDLAADLSEVCAIADQGEIYFQACLVNVEVVKKTFKDLSTFLPNFQFVLSTEGTGRIEVFDYDICAHDGVDLQIEHFDYFYSSLSAPRTFHCTINAKDFLECIMPVPSASTVIMFYISENCLDQQGEVFQLSIRIINLLKDVFYDKNIRTKTSQHASLLSNIKGASAAGAGGGKRGGGGGKGNKAGGDAMESLEGEELQALVTKLTREECQKHHCIVQWGIKDLLQSLQNSMAMSKEARVITFTANNGDEFVFECNAGNNLSGKARAFNRQTEICKFRKFDPPSSVCRIVTNSFRVTSIHNFMKCRDLCTDVQLYFDQNLPLIMEFTIPNFGVLRMFTPSFDNSQDF